MTSFFDAEVPYQLLVTWPSLSADSILEELASFIATSLRYALII